MSQTETALSNFKPFVVRTENIAKDLLSTAGKFGVKASAFDFNLLSVQTFLAYVDKKTEEEEILADEFDRLNDEKILADPNVRIFQTYEIEIILAQEDEHFPKLQLSIGANPTMSHIFASIKPGSYVEYFDGIEKELLKFINKRKLRANMLINIWDKNLRSEISKFVAKVQVAQKLEITERISFEVGMALDSVTTVDDKLIMHYEKKKVEKESDKVDHVNRGFVKGVMENDLLIEYIKPKMGTPGRNCRGAFIAPTVPVIKYGPTFAVSDKIQVIDTEDSIEYRAKSGGYIVFENNTYDIKVEIEVTEINFKTTGSISAGIDSDVKLNVKETDAFKDAIGAGMEIEVNEINVDGNVGQNAIIKARKVNIGGQTHQSSYIEADDIEVKIHKGKIKGKRVKIERLEQGIVEADFVEISQATGGKIIAKEVIIDSISSHVNVMASSKIEIKNFNGEENTFMISPILYAEQKESLSGNEEEILVQKRKVRSLEEELASNKKILDDNSAAITDIKKRLAHYKSSGAKMPSSFVAKFKEFQNLQKRVASLTEELAHNRSKLELLSAKTNSFQDNILNAKIINHDHYKGHNEIRFKLIDPDIELYFVPRGGAGEKCFMLEQEADSEKYVIVAKDNI